MRTFILSLLLLLATVTGRANTPPVAPYDAMAVVHVEAMSDAMLAALAKHIGTERTVTLEYSCTWAGIVVLHFTNTTAAEKADVITLALRHLSEAGITKGVEVKHVELRAVGGGKC
jgi:hypothetical protein